MKKVIRKGVEIAGIDRAIMYTLFTRIIQGGSGVISVLFIARFLTKSEQGYYYTFGSILAIQIFFELGLNGIITQYVAHENSHLSWSNNFELIGDIKYKSRLSSILHLCIKWFSIISILLLSALLISGLFFFTHFENKESEEITWKIPWTILACSTSLTFILTPLLAFLEGLDKVKEVAKIRLYQQIGYLIVFFTLMYYGAKLYSGAIASMLSFCIGISIIIVKYKQLLVNIWKQKVADWVINYLREIFPYQWRIALSWMSGFFIFQLFNPVLFATEGPVVAGQMGMSLAVLNGLSGVSMSWITTKVPVFSKYIAQKAYETLDDLFNKTLKQIQFINIGGLIIFILTIFCLQYFELGIANRFLPLFPLILLSITVFINQMVFAWATYLRCHKKEPFLINSIAGGIVSGLSTFFLGKHFGLMGIVGGYTLLVFTFSFWGYYIFKTNQQQWHHASNC